jgi:hypothetical protein
MIDLASSALQNRNFGENILEDYRWLIFREGEREGQR